MKDNRTSEARSRLVILKSGQGQGSSGETTDQNLTNQPYLIIVRNVQNSFASITVVSL